jgi:hypothetical protein
MFRFVSSYFDGELFYLGLWINIASFKIHPRKWFIFVWRRNYIWVIGNNFVETNLCAEM